MQREHSKGVFQPFKKKKTLLNISNLTSKNIAKMTNAILAMQKSSLKMHRQIDICRFSDAKLTTKSTTRSSFLDLAVRISLKKSTIKSALPALCGTKKEQIKYHKI